MKFIKPSDLEQESWNNIIDVRTADEFMREYIEGSVNVPLDNLQREALQWDRARSIILSCRSGARAKKAHQLLTELGFVNLTLLEGAMVAWQEAKLPVMSLKQGGISIMRQVQIIVGVMVLSGFLVPMLWFFIPIAGAGMLFAGLSNTCMMASVLGKMPWNQTPNLSSERVSGQVCTMSIPSESKGSCCN